MTLLAIAIVPLAVGASRLFSKEETEAIYPPRPSRPYLEHAAKGEKLINDNVKNFLLGYIHEENIKPEAESDAKDAEQNKRIKRKNELLQEYRAIVDKMCEEKVLKIKDYEEKYEYLMGLISQLIELEPEKLPQELLAGKMRRLLLHAEEHVYYSGVHKDYAKNHKIDLPALKQFIADLKNLKNDYESGKTSYKESQKKFDEYVKIWNNNKIALFVAE